MDSKEIDRLSELERCTDEYKQARNIILAIEELNIKVKALSSNPVLETVAGQLAAIDRQMERVIDSAAKGINKHRDVA